MQFYSLQVYKIADLTKYSTLMPLYAPPDYAVTMNVNTFNSLPADLQKVITDSLPGRSQQTLAAYQQADADGKAYGLKMGIQFITLTPDEKANWIKIIQPVQETQAAALDAKGSIRIQTC